MPRRPRYGRGRYTAQAMQTKDALTLNKAKDKIKEALMRMFDQGYDFAYVTWPELDEDEEGCKISTFDNVFLRFECRKKKKHKQVNKFTTNQGTAQLKFQFEPIKRFLKIHPQFKKGNDESALKDPYVLKWDLRIYLMECKICSQNHTSKEFKWAKPFIYKPQVQRIIAQFYERISSFLNNTSSKKKRKAPKMNYRPQFKPRLRGHISELCEACIKGMCKLKSNSRTTNDHSGSDGQSNASSNNDYGYERD